VATSLKEGCDGVVKAVGDWTGVVVDPNAGFEVAVRAVLMPRLRPLEAPANIIFALGVVAFGCDMAARCRVDAEAKLEGFEVALD
jgi:hypothetical protein